MRKLLCLLVLAGSCAPPPYYYTPSFPSLPQVQAGDTPEQVVNSMGAPSSRTNGWWWNDRIAYSTEYQVWGYRGVGRVIFDRWTRKVVATEADLQECGAGGNELM